MEAIKKAIFMEMSNEAAERRLYNQQLDREERAREHQASQAAKMSNNGAGMGK